jgi:uncharacterized protein
VQEALEAAVAELVLGPDFDVQDPAAVEAWLARHGISTDDAKALRERELARLVAYRKLVRGTLRHAVELAIPRSMARLGPLFDEYFQRFLAERGPRTHYLRDVTAELLDFCAPLWATDARIPGYLLDLSRLEALHIQIAAAPLTDQAAEPCALQLDAGLSFTQAACLLRSEFRVHELSESLFDRTAPARGATQLLVYRSPDHDVRYLELTPLAAAILEHLFSGCSLKESLTRASKAEGSALDDQVLTGTARLLADLAERGVVLGPCAPGEKLARAPSLPSLTPTPTS